MKHIAEMLGEKMALDRDQLFLSIAHELPRMRDAQRAEEAIQWLQSLIREEAGDHELTMTARMGIASCFMDLKRYDEAEQLINTLSSAVVSREDVFHVQQLRVNLLKQTKRFEACIELAEKLLFDPLMLEEAYQEVKAELLSTVGFEQTWLGRYSDAMQSLADSLPGTPNSERRDSILLYQAVCLRAQNQPVGALTKIEEGLTTGTGLLKGDFAYQQGLALKESGRKLEAQTAFLRAYADADFGNTSREDILLEMVGTGNPS